MKRFEINCDLGEGTGNDGEIIPHLDACNIACGGHFGDENTMRQTIRLAKKHGVSVGAHPSFPDKEKFGRQVMDIPEETLLASLLEQVRAFEKICKEEEVPMNHIKPHGALYNLAAEDQKTARLIIDLVKQFPQAKLYAPWESAVAKLATKEEVPVKWEAFADRKYTNDRTLVSRSNPEAVITEPNLAAEQVFIILTESMVISIDEKIVQIKANTVCIHSDNPNAPEIAKRVKQLRG